MLTLNVNNILWKENKVQEGSFRKKQNSEALIFFFKDMELRVGLQESHKE